MKTTKQFNNPTLKPTTNLKAPIKQPHLKTSINQTVKRKTVRLKTHENAAPSFHPECPFF